MKHLKSSLILLPLLILKIHFCFSQWDSIIRLSETDSASSALANSLVSSGQYIHVIWNDYYAGTRCLVYRRSTDNGVSWNTLVPLTRCRSYLYFFTYSSGSNVHFVYDSLGLACYRRSTDNGATWSPSDSLCSRDYQLFNFIANNAGFIFAFWRRGYQFPDTIYITRSTNNGTTWTQPERITMAYTYPYLRNVLNSDFPPYVFYVYSSYYYGTNDTIFFKRSVNNGANWEVTTPLVITTGLGNCIFMADNKNRLHLAWNDSHTGNGEVYYIRSTNYGVSWGDIMRLTISSGSFLYWAGAKDDMVYLSYTNPTTYKTRRRSFDGGTTWEGESDWPVAGLIPFVFGDSNWIHLLGYRYIYPTGYAIAYFRSKNSGTTWSDSAIPISDTDNYDRLPRAIALAGGNVHALWEDYKYGNYEVFYRRGVGLAGVKEENSKVKIQSAKFLEVYPNPAKGVVRVRGPLTVKEAGEIKIFDVAGKVIREIATTALQSRNDGAVVISLKGINTGIYFLQLESEIRKFLVVR